jgi:hypothetical protein
MIFLPIATYLYIRSNRWVSWLQRHACANFIYQISQATCTGLVDTAATVHAYMLHGLPLSYLLEYRVVHSGAPYVDIQNIWITSFKRVHFFFEIIHAHIYHHATYACHFSRKIRIYVTYEKKRWIFAILWIVRVYYYTVNNTLLFWCRLHNLIP